jgi:riboflavin biosynthesis pyrimidine reductase
LAAFQRFYRENADRWLGSTAYVEAGPQLLAQAFVQRVVDGVGRIRREYALGRKRTDLVIEWPLDPAQGSRGPVQRIVIELKLLRSGSLDSLIAQALPQAAEYADRVGADETHLVVFDRTGRTTWDERVWQTTETVSGRTIGVWGA